MGIFGDIASGLGEILSTPVAQQAAGALLQRYTQPRTQVVYAGGPPVSTVPISYPSMAGSATLTQSSFPLSTQVPGSYTPVQALEVPQPVPYGLDPSCPSLFRPMKQTASPERFLTAKNPVTGRTHWWEHCGQPVLFSRDLRVCRRVGKIAARASRSRGRRTYRRKR
jgi:hypothetical protein